MRTLIMIAVLCFSTIHADERAETLPIGLREMTVKERMVIQERRAQREADGFCEEEPLEVKNGLGNAKSLNYTTHQGAFHHPALITPLGDLVELEDGSKWGVYSSDRNKTYNWLTTDSIQITPNHAWFSSYQYRLTNLNTSESIEVNLVDRPIYNGVNTHWIVAINSLNDELCLDDGSVWSLSGFDYSIYSKWVVNDTLIIGTNDGFFKSNRPNILINCETNNYVDARCVN